MYTTMMTTLTALMFPTIIMLIMSITSMKLNLNREKATPFECGFDPKSSARIPFSLRFFLLAVIFLVFDIEIVLLLPTPLSIHLNANWSIISTFLFLLILTAGLLHEWREGSLNWQS